MSAPPPPPTSGARVAPPRSGWARLIATAGVWTALVALLTLPAAWPLLQPGFIATRAGGDSPFLLIRLHQLLAGLALGFPVRWMPDAAHSLGYPFWNFYAPLPYYLAALFSNLGLGTIAPLKLAQLLGFLVAAWGMDALAREVWGSRPAGLLAAVAYTYAPFHLVNVYVRGDSLGEFWAFAFYPLTWLAAERLLRRPSARPLVGLALAYAGLILSHNISALIFSPFLIAYSVLRISPSAFRLPPSVLRLASFVVGLLLALALSAWFWYPALAERGLVQLSVNLSGFFSYTGHFRGLDLVQPGWTFDYDPANGAAFALGLLQTVAALLGLTVVWLGRREASGTRLALTLTLLLAVLCITPLSRPLWENLPLLPFAQFPWRFLSVASFAAALLTGGLAAPPSPKPRPFPPPLGEGPGEGPGVFEPPLRPSPQPSPIGRGGMPSQARGTDYLIVAVVGLALAVAGLARLTPTRIPVADSEVTAERIALYEVFTGNIGTTIRAEYLPQAVQPPPQLSTAWLSPDGQPTVVTLQGEVGPVQRLGPDRWRVDVASPNAALAFPRLAYPGWRAWVDGRPGASGVAPGLGYLSVPLTAGRHEVAFTFEHTSPRLAAELVSLLALLVVAGLWVVGGRGTRVSSGWWVVGAWAVGLGLVGLALRPAPPAPTALLTTNLDYVRLPWLHAAPQGVPYSHGARLAGYALAGAARESAAVVGIEAGGTLTVTLEWATVSGGWADVVLVSPAEHRFGVSYQVANERVRLAPQTVHRLDVPADTTLGLYWLRVRVQDAQSEEAWPLDDVGLARGRLYLLPVHVHPPTPPPTTSSSQARRLTEAVSLLDVGWQQRSRSQLFVNLTWLTTQSLTDNYVTSLRLVDAAGQMVASEDQPPGYGYFPTIAWTPGRPVLDRRRLTLPDGLPAGAYGLDIVLYQRATLTELGRVRLDGVTLDAVPR